MPASMTGLPQWMFQRAQTFNAAAQGSTSESAFMALQGQDKFTGTIYAESAASLTITGGPQTVGPVIIWVNGVAWALPFNVATSCPDYVRQALAEASGTQLGAQWVWS